MRDLVKDFLDRLTQKDHADKHQRTHSAPTPEEAARLDAADESHMPGTSHRPPRGTGG